MFAKEADPKKVAAENKALRSQLNHLSEELVKANERIGELQQTLNAEKAEGEAKSSLLKQQRAQTESLVVDMSAREELIASLKEEIRRTDARVQSLEKTGKVREAELQRLLEQESAAAMPRMSNAGSDGAVSPLNPVRALDGAGSPTSGASDMKSPDGHSMPAHRPRRRSTLADVQPLLQRSTVLLYNIDSPMMESQTDHIVGRALGMAGFVNSLVKQARAYCDSGREFTSAGEKLAETLMSAR
jgi:hypothetical protein